MKTTGSAAKTMRSLNQAENGQNVKSGNIMKSKKRIGGRRKSFVYSSLALLLTN